MKKSTLLLAPFLISVLANAQSGSLDLSFDADGKVTTAIGSTNDEGSSIAIQGDGKILVAGYSYNGADYDFALVRYNSDGSLDNSFDSDGIVTTPVGASDDYAQSVAIQTDGKILVAGYSFAGAGLQDFALARYNTNGSLDISFSGDGIVTTPIGIADDYLKSVAIQTDGKIVVAGSSFNGINDDFALVRYNSDGTLDNTFDSDGIVITTLGSSYEQGNSVIIQTDGKIVVAGYSIGADSDFALVRYNSNGSLDNTFDSDGKVTTNIGSANDLGYSVGIQTDGKILVAGNSFIGGDYDFALVRYNTNGTLDTTFDSDGKLTTDIGFLTDDRGQSVVIQGDNKILVAGYSFDGTSNDFASARYNSNGSLDIGFDSDGKVTTPIGSTDDRSYSAAIQTDGKIVLAGYSFNGTDNVFALVRYNNVLTTGMEEESGGIGDWAVSIYPNPVKDQLSFNMEQTQNNIGVSVYDISGRIILFTNLYGAQNRLDMTTLQPGIYIVQISDGKLSKTFKVIKE